MLNFLTGLTNLNVDFPKYDTRQILSPTEVESWKKYLSEYCL